MSEPASAAGSATLEQVKAATDLATAHLEKHSDYHDHKETMAYAATTLSATTLYLTGASVWLFSESFWKPPLPLHPGIILAGVLLIGVIVVGFVRWQLVNRTNAAVVCAACHDLLAEWVTNPPKQKCAIEARVGMNGLQWPRVLADRMDAIESGQRRTLFWPSFTLLAVVVVWTLFLLVRTLVAWCLPTMGQDGGV